MSLSLLSFNYKNTPVELREKLALGRTHLPDLLRESREVAGLHELMVLSTCNRVEYYFTNGRGDNPEGRLLEWLNRRFFVSDGTLERSAILLSDRAALTHVFRVGCSLESMVIGEPQILGQLKEAYQIAAECRTTGAVLNGLLPKVFHTAKRVRNETGIARFAVSVSYAAAELAGRIFETLEDKTVMVIGAGEMAELAVAHLRKKGIRRLLITNRTFANGVELAEKFMGEAVRYEEMTERLPEADIVISSTGARGYVIDQDMARRAHRARKGKPVFLIDIAVPRDVDPAVNELADVYCYDIDDLQAAADANRAEREREALAAQELIEREVAAYEAWVSANAVTPLIKALRTQFTELGQRETDKLLARLEHLPERDQEAVRRLAHTLVNKLLHGPSTRLKQLGEEPHGHVYADALAELFALQPAEGRAPAAGAGEDERENVVRFPGAGDAQS